MDRFAPRAKVEALTGQLHAANASIAMLREQQQATQAGSRIAQAASAATAAALRDTSFAEQTCARVEQLLLRAQLQQRQKNDPTRTRKVRRVAPPS